jgi:hypothetical protein
VLGERTMETTTNGRCHWKPGCHIPINVPLNQNFFISGDIIIQCYYLSTQTEVFIENTLLMFSNPYQPPCMDSTLSSLLSALNDRKVCNVSKGRMESINSFYIACVFHHVCCKRDDYQSYMETVIQGRLCQHRGRFKSSLRREESVGFHALLAS